MWYETGFEKRNFLMIALKIRIVAFLCLSMLPDIVASDPLNFSKEIISSAGTKAWFEPRARGSYAATLYQDDEPVDTRTRVSLTNKKVTSSTEFTLKLKASGGVAVWVREQ